MPTYHPAEIEPRWQQFWQANKTFRTVDPGDPTVAGKPKYYILDMFPYPSGAGLHVGHPEGYTATDILARFKRMHGFHVLHPMGWDAFGLPAEEYARKTGTHPRLTTATNVDTFRRQIQSLGFSYDWDREVDTTDPDYFRWTQFIFLTIHDTWYDAAQNRGRPISELPIPDGMTDPDAVRKYQDSQRLAYQGEAMVNWCPAMGTVLANEEVVDGKSDIGNHPVERRALRQWLLRITSYAERLLSDLDTVEWPDSIKAMQRQWIGKSEGAEVLFEVVRGGGSAGLGTYAPPLYVYTTRPDTLYGATYMVLSPEHSFVNFITTEEQRPQVEAYQRAAQFKSDMERTDLAKTKTGVFTGAYALNPANGKEVPIWIADYVLASYGTGAIMAVPAHDERDFDFATKFGLPIATVVQPTEAWLRKTGSTLDKLTRAFVDDGLLVNSDDLNGLTTDAAKKKITSRFDPIQCRLKVNFKLRDWLFSRQRYWGEPFPLLHELADDGRPNGVVRRLGVEDLPLKLPDLADFNPDGNVEGPVAKATEWVNVTLDGKRYKRETNTMPQWAGSCWYYLRYIDPKNSGALADPAKLKHWLPVDLYVGGAEHAVLHLLYSRFWHKVLFDRGIVPCAEPFQRLVNQGMILGEPEYIGLEDNNCVPVTWKQYRTHFEYDGLPREVVVPEEEVERVGGIYFRKGYEGIQLMPRSSKMSKSRGNVVNPDDVVREYGADSLRLYEMFLGPLEATKPWNTKGVEGVSRFLARVWRLVVDDTAETLTLNPKVSDTAPSPATLREQNRVVQKVTIDTERMQFNTAISAMMELTNHLTGLEARPRSTLEALVLLLAPYAPHAAEEFWRALGHGPTLAYEPWPAFDPALVAEDEIEVAVQIAGKVKARLKVPADVTDAALEVAALDHADVIAALAGRTPKKVIVVPRRMVNIVV